MKKRLFLTAVCVLAILFGGCTSATPSPDTTPIKTPEPTPVRTPAPERPEAKKLTKGINEFTITYYYGPCRENFTNETYYQAIAECGFTSVGLNTTWDTTDEEIRIALGYLRKYGLKCDSLPIFDVLNAINTASPEQIDEIVKNAVERFKEYDDVITGWNLRDEPQATDFAKLKVVVDAFRKYSPDDAVFINLFPNYASEEQLATATYEEYLERFVNEIGPDYISWDHYAILGNNTERYGYFDNLESVRDCYLRHGLDAVQIILLTKHLAYKNVTYDDLCYEVNTSLCYGMKAVSYFTFYLDESLMASNWTDSCMNYLGEKYQHYYDVQKINKWLLPLGKELYGKTSTAVFHISNSLQKNCTEYTSYGDLGKIHSLINKNLMVGFFNDDSFMIVNTERGELNIIQLEEIFQADNLEYFDTETASWKSATESDSLELTKADNYVLTLEAGQAILLRAAK